MEAKLRQEIEEVLAEASVREFSTMAIFQSYLVLSLSPVRAMRKAFTVGQAWQRVADEALLGRQ
ncbi:MAG: hypothetical protein QMC90_03100 [Dehalococcoidales bacterium]|nr:hypothetical protein [Dehalococcoidales bacterium]